MSSITDGNQIWPKIQQQSIVYSKSHIKFCYLHRMTVLSNWFWLEVNELESPQREFPALNHFNIAIYSSDQCGYVISVFPFFVETQKLLIRAIITFSRDFILSPLMTGDIY